MSAGFRIAAALMTAVFLLSAGVQWNDPDPWLWIGLYGLAALLSLAAALGRVPFMSNAAALGLFLVFAALWVPSLLGSRSEAFTSFEMKTKSDEEPREAGGLLLCAAWSAWLTRSAWRLRATRSPSV